MRFSVNELILKILIFFTTPGQMSFRQNRSFRMVRELRKNNFAPDVPGTVNRQIMVFLKQGIDIIYDAETIVNSIDISVL